MAKAVRKLIAYSANRTSGAFAVANSAVVRNTNTCKRAEHSENGMTSMVNSRSPRERITRVPISAGTLQPKPISSITNPRPSNPSRAISASIKKAMRDRYPLSSTSAMPKKNSTMTGTKEATVPRPS